MNNRMIARIARKGGSKLLDIAVTRLFPHAPASKAKAASAAVPAPGSGAKLNLTELAAGLALTRFAQRSVPGAIVLGGSLLAKTLYDRRKARESMAADQEGADGDA